ncbi:MAG: hypothetical protein ACI81I_000187 [Arcobacteraceae bacterium]|jgi:hypothetical protein|tara:strand:- start:61 stop:393 length:333 start_codon:yes stop_codon:yes gene_type:complete
MSKSWKKYTNVFKNINQIAEGIKNNIFKKEHIEAVAKERFQTCIKCSMFDAKGTDCLAPGTQPCCSDCGCSLAFKVRSLSSECPKGYWKSLMSEETEEIIIKQIDNEQVN